MLESSDLSEPIRGKEEMTCDGPEDVAHAALNVEEPVLSQNTEFEAKCEGIGKEATASGMSSTSIPSASSKPPVEIDLTEVEVQTSKIMDSPNSLLFYFHNIPITKNDYDSLNNEMYLNDELINFYLKYLYFNVLQPEERDMVHIFSTSFYARLTTQVRFKEEVGLSAIQKKHSRVKFWTKNVNIFEKKFVLIPVCEHSHWYLAIFINPGNISLNLKSRKERGEPLLLILDSLGYGQTKSDVILRQYLQQEWLEKKPGLEEVCFSKKEMKTVKPKKPEQKNFTDCGIFLLHYAEKVITK